MKKLTAGIFAGILTVVATSAANANIASQGYVDAQVNTRVPSSRVDATVANHAFVVTTEAQQNAIPTAAQVADVITNSISTANTYDTALFGEDGTASSSINAPTTKIVASTIADMDYSTSNENKAAGKFVHYVDETDGKITPTTAAFVMSLDADSNIAPTTTAVRAGLGTKVDNSTYNTAMSNIAVTTADGVVTVKDDEGTSASVYSTEKANALFVEETEKLTAYGTNGENWTDSANAGKLPTVKTVEDRITAATATGNFIEDAINDGVTNKAPSENAVHDALSKKQNIELSNDTITGDGVLDSTNHNTVEKAITGLDGAVKTNANNIDTLATNTAAALNNKMQLNGDAKGKLLTTDANGQITNLEIGNAADGQYILTAKKVDGTVTYNWEVISRSDATAGANGDAAGVTTATATGAPSATSATVTTTNITGNYLLAAQRS